MATDPTASRPFGGAVLLWPVLVNSLEFLGIGDGVVPVTGARVKAKIRIVVTRCFG